MTVYTKSCVYCHETYTSESRGQRYCSPECCEKAQEVNKKKTKHRRAKRKEYHENREINVALSTAYSLAKRVAKLYYIPESCGCERLGLEGKCTGELELHHRDFNPFNNHPDNLVWLCKSHHAAVHNGKTHVNMVETYKEAVDTAGFEDDDKKYIVMIDVFNKRVTNSGLIHETIHD